MNAIVRLGPAFIGIGVDASDSMSGLEKEVLEGVNAQAQVLLETATDRTFLSVASFSDNVKPMFSGEIPRFRGVNKETYKIHGSTSLLDCLGYLLDEMEPQVEDPCHGVSPATGLVVLFTDGEENTSRLYGPEHSPAHRRLQARVARLRATGRWTFCVMGPEDGLDATCALLGFPRGNARPFRQGQAGARQSFGETSASLTGYMDARARGIASSEEFYGPAGALPKVGEE